MQLLKCEITNFGKLHDYSHDFKNGLNVFCEVNGYGKSTLMCFIKSMFYGLKKADRENYKPWNGGVFGGKITYESGGETFTISRTFGEKESEDKAELLNSTGSPQKANNLGARLFNLDAEAFERTAYLPHKLGTENFDGMTTKIHALLESSSDALKYEKEKVELNKTIAALNATKTGEIEVLKGKLSKIQSKLELCNLAQTRADEKKEEILSIESEIADTKKTYARIEEELRLYNESETHNAVVKAYKNYAKSVELKRAELEKLKTFFQNFTPTLEEIEEQKNTLERANELNGEIKALRSQISAIKLKSVEKPQFENFYTENIIENSSKNAKSEVAASKNKQHSQAVNDEDVISSTEEEIEKNSNQTSSINAQSALVNTTKKKSKTVPICLVFIILGLCGVVGISALFILEFVPLLTTIITLGAIVALEILLLIIMIVSMTSKKGKNKNTASEEVAAAKNLFIQGENNVKSNINSGENASENTAQKAFNFAQQNSETTFARDEKNTQISADEQQLRENKSTSSAYSAESLSPVIIDSVPDFDIEAHIKAEEARKSKAENAYNLAVAKFEMIEAENVEKRALIKELEEKIVELSTAQNTAISSVNEFIGNFENNGGSPSKILNDLGVKLYNLTSYANELKTLEKDLVKYKKDNEVAASEKFISSYKGRTITAIKADESKIKDSLTAQNESLTQAKVAEAKLRSETHELTSLSSENTDLEKQLKNALDRLSDTRQALVKLESEYTTLQKEYLPNMVKNFTKYVTKLSNITSIQMDKNFNILIEDAGHLRELSSYSSGYKNIFEFCRRLALVDLMFKDNKSFIILDDPFVNLDSKHLQEAKELVKNIASDFQVVYFTCHESRV